MTTPLTRVITTRVTAADYDRLTATHPDECPSAAARIAIQTYPPRPVCAAREPGSFGGALRPYCALPSGHDPLPHWWRHPTGPARTWWDTEPPKEPAA